MEGARTLWEPFQRRHFCLLAALAAVVGALRVSLEGEVSGGWEGAVWATARPGINSVEKSSRPIEAAGETQESARAARHSAATALIFYSAFNFIFLNMRIVGETISEVSADPLIVWKTVVGYLPLLK